jgi:single-strand DNA-binding protein
MNLNVVNLVGRAGTDPDTKYFESGKRVCKLTLAVNRPTSKDDKPDWFNLEMWDKTAEVATNYVRKGSLIGIQGSLKIETWTDRNNPNLTRSRPVIRVDRLELLGGKRDTDPNAVGGYGNDEM